MVNIREAAQSGKQVDFNGRFNGGGHALGADKLDSIRQCLVVSKQMPDAVCNYFKINKKCC